MTEQELVKKIAQLIDKRCSETEEFYTGNSWILRYKLTSEELADQILALIKEAGYVKLVKDQSMPELAGYKVAQEELLKAGWRKVEL